MAKRTSFVLAGLAAAAGLALALPGFAYAQQVGGPPNPPAQNAPPKGNTPNDKPAEPAVPRSVLASLLTNTPQSTELLQRFIAGGGANPDAISSRSVELVTALQQTGMVTDKALLATIAQRVATAASQALDSRPILKLNVDKTFTAPPGVRAYDFGPPDKAVQHGFERILPNNPMLSGNVRGLRRPGDEAGLLSGGVAGVKKIDVKLPDGEYRITLMTEALGDAALTLAPFGNMVDANGQPVQILSAPPDQWSRSMMLNSAGLTSGGTESSNGGGITFVVRVVGGQLKLDFNFAGGNPQNLQTYLTGMVIEPATQPSIFARTPDAPPIAPPSPATQLRTESTLLASILNKVTEPAAGQPVVPVVDDRTAASPS